MNDGGALYNPVELKSMIPSWSWVCRSKKVVERLWARLINNHTIYCDYWSFVTYIHSFVFIVLPWTLIYWLCTFAFSSLFLIWFCRTSSTTKRSWTPGEPFWHNVFRISVYGFMYLRNLNTLFQVGSMVSFPTFHLWSRFGSHLRPKPCMWIWLSDRDGFPPLGFSSHI